VAQRHTRICRAVQDEVNSSHKPTCEERQANDESCRNGCANNQTAHQSHQRWVKWVPAKDLCKLCALAAMKAYSLPSAPAALGRHARAVAGFSSPAGSASMPHRGEGHTAAVKGAVGPPRVGLDRRRRWQPSVCHASCSQQQPASGLQVCRDQEPRSAGARDEPAEQKHSSGRVRILHAEAFSAG
jgi:hypothetical protein